MKAFFQDQAASLVEDGIFSLSFPHYLEIVDERSVIKLKKWNFVQNPSSQTYITTSKILTL